MINVNYCRCNDVNSRKRNHHGVICTLCNPSFIEPLLIPNEITAYRTWSFDVEYGLTPRIAGGTQSWNDFNSSPPPTYSINSLYDDMKPWSRQAICRYNNHPAPDPYCSCGYYSIKEFGVSERRYNSFSHDSTQNIINRFNRNVYNSLQVLSTQSQKAYAELFFYSPAMKTLELKEFPILSEVALRGKIIECEKGYRSQKVEAKKFFLLINFFELNTISQELGQFLNKDNSEVIHSTIVWLDFLNNYIKSISKLYGCSFEMRVNVNKNNPIDSNLFNPPDWDNGYLSFEKDLYINERLRGIADTVLISNKLLKKQPHPDLDEIRRITPLSDTGRIRRVHNHDVNFENLLRKNLHGEFYDNLEDNIRAYQEKIFAFFSLYECITKSNTGLSATNDNSDLIDLSYRLFLKNYKRIQGLEPKRWFPVLFSYLENFIDINKNFNEVLET